MTGPPETLDDGIVLAQIVHDATGDSWRLRRDPTGALQLDSISARSLERGLCWAYCCPVIDERVGSQPTSHNARLFLIDAVARYMHGVAINARNGATL